MAVLRRGRGHGRARAWVWTSTGVVLRSTGVSKAAHRLREDVHGRGTDVHAWVWACGAVSSAQHRLHTTTYYVNTSLNTLSSLLSLSSLMNESLGSLVGYRSFLTLVLSE